MQWMDGVPLLVSRQTIADPSGGQCIVAAVFAPGTECQESDQRTRGIKKPTAACAGGERGIGFDDACAIDDVQRANVAEFK